MHTDICGPMSVESFKGNRYFLLFINYYSRMSWIFSLKHKSKTFENFKKFKVLMEKQSGCSIKALRSDRGGKFNSNEFNICCEESDIHRELTAPYTLEQNGVAEQKNRTVVEMARSMMAASGISKEFWAEGVATTVYLLNISPTKAVRNQTSYEAWKGRKL